MKALLLALALITTSAAYADSEATLKSCLSKVYSQASTQNGKSKDISKFVSTNVKACKDSVKSIAKSEKDAKRKAKLADQIKKLQAKLTSN